MGDYEKESSRLRESVGRDYERIRNLTADRVRRAADRHKWARQHREGYPTKASAYADPDEVRTVGSFDPGSGQLTITDAGVLADWLDVDHLPDSELELTTEA